MTDEKNDGGRAKVGGLTAGAMNRAKLAEKRRQAPYPSPGMAHDGVSPGTWYEAGYCDETGLLPKNCPVRPLGYDGENYYFVDTSGQVFNTGDSALGVERIQKLFAGHEDFLYWAWPAKEPKKMIADPTFKSERIRRDLFAACRERGAWSATDMVRGRGAWRDNDGRLILHCGDHMWIDGKMEDTGEIGDYFYARRPPSISPWGEPVPPSANPAVEVFEILRTWNFERGDTDAMLLLGSIGIGMLGGALDWRPSVFIIGDAGVGKSELTGKHGVLKTIFGRLMVSTTNATEAGLYQLVGHDSVPISIDELEGEDGLDQAQRVIKMARDAASGSVRIRGGSNHKGVEFQAQSVFYFSGINPPPIPPASLTRLALIQLLPLKASATAKAPVLQAAETVGPRLMRVLADNWVPLQERLEDYYAVLREHGHDSRGQKTFGTFLAVAHTMLGEEGLKKLGLPREGFENGLKPWGERLHADILPELEGKQPTWQQCIGYILTSIIDNFSGGQRRTVAQELEKISTNKSIEGAGFPEIRDKLAAADIGLFGTVPTGLILAVPNQSKTLGRLLADTPFGDKGGNGSWRYALRRGPPNIVTSQMDCGGGRMDNRVSVAGRQVRCTFIHLKEFIKWQDT